QRARHGWRYAAIVRFLSRRARAQPVIGTRGGAIRSFHARDRSPLSTLCCGNCRYEACRKPGPSLPTSGVEKEESAMAVVVKGRRSSRSETAAKHRKAAATSRPLPSLL